MDEIQALMESHPRAHLEPDSKIHELMDRGRTLLRTHG